VKRTKELFTTTHGISRACMVALFVTFFFLHTVQSFTIHGIGPACILRLSSSQHRRHLKAGKRNLPFFFFFFYFITSFYSFFTLWPVFKDFYVVAVGRAHLRILRRNVEEMGQGGGSSSSNVCRSVLG
jgi:hypothetical protein